MASAWYMWYFTAVSKVSIRPLVISIFAKPWAPKAPIITAKAPSKAPAIKIDLCDMSEDKSLRLKVTGSYVYFYLSFKNIIR